MMAAVFLDTRASQRKRLRSFSIGSWQAGRVESLGSGDSEEGRKMVDVGSDASVAADRERGQSYVVFRLGGEGYALEVMRVQEVLDMQSLTEVPGGPKFLLGVINLRGHVVPVYDLRMPFGLAPGLRTRPGSLRADRRVEFGGRHPDHRTLGGPRFRRAGVFSRGSASRAAAWTWEGYALRPRPDSSPGCLFTRIGRRSSFLDTWVVER